jgi:hypothetical protein
MEPTSNTDLELEIWTTLQLCRIVDSPRALTVFLLISNGEWEQYMELTWNPDHYLDPWHGALDRQVSEMMRKSQNVPLGIDKDAVAKAAFFTAENACSRTNSRLERTDYVDHPSWWRRAERNIARILGELTVDDLQRVVDAARLGPGSVLGLWKEEWVPSDKFDMMPTACDSLLPVLEGLMPEGWKDYRPEVEVLEHNKWLSVLKDALKNRGICKSSVLSIFYQLGVGDLLRQRLRRTGIDLRDQERNRKLAQQAWNLGLATLDLVQASDMLAYRVPVQLLPDEWEHLLALGRERFTMIDGEKVELAKYCAMGNGYTFPLQTLLFWAVVTAVVPVEQHELCSVYGDDIICPQSYAAEVVDALDYLGFRVNAKKSFLAGSFFESCGTDWLYGQNVRPFYLRRELGSENAVPTPYALQIANNLRIWGSRIMGHTGCWSQLKGLWSKLIRQVPRPWAECKVPVHFGDSGVITSLCEARPKRAQDGLQGWQVKSVRLTSVLVDKRTPGVLLAALAGARATPIGINDVRQSTLDPGLQVWLWENGCQNEVVENSGTATKGMEPVRGLYGKVRVGKAVAFTWPHGFDWI